MYFPKACCNHYSRILEHTEYLFQRAFNVTQQLFILVLYCAKTFFVNFKIEPYSWQKHSDTTTTQSKMNRLILR